LTVTRTAPAPRRAYSAPLALVFALSTAAAIAQAQPAAAPQFEITGFRVEGATLLTPAEIDAAVKPFVGAPRSFADVQGAVGAIEEAYAAKGYSAVRVVVPEQTLQRGEVMLKVIEAKLGRIAVEGNRFFDDVNVRASLPALEAGEAPNIAALAGNLRLANENPSKQTTVLLKRGATDGEVDAHVRVADDRTQKFSLSTDNTGTPPTGQYRVGVGYQNANLWNRDHVFNAQYVTSPSKPGDVAIVAGSYRIPIYSLGEPEQQRQPAVRLRVGAADCSGESVRREARKLRRDGGVLIESRIARRCDAQELCHRRWSPV